MKRVKTILYWIGYAAVFSIGARCASGIWGEPPPPTEAELRATLYKGCFTEVSAVDGPHRADQACNCIWTRLRAQYTVPQLLQMIASHSDAFRLAGVQCAADFADSPR
jgi:hypothetical protein